MSEALDEVRGQGRYKVTHRAARTSNILKRTLWKRHSTSHGAGAVDHCSCDKGDRIGTQADHRCASAAASSGRTLPSRALTLSSRDLDHARSTSPSATSSTNATSRVSSRRNGVTSQSSLAVGRLCVSIIVRTSLARRVDKVVPTRLAPPCTTAQCCWPVVLNESSIGYQICRRPPVRQGNSGLSRI